MVPLFVRFPVPDMVILPVEMLMVPLLSKLPVTVNVLVPRDKMDPEFTVKPTQAVLVPTVTTLLPVVAITTLSVVAGTTPPTQVVPKDQVPPVALLVMVAACKGVDIPVAIINMATIRKTFV